jgi:hypothetical protein
MATATWRLLVITDALLVVPLLGLLEAGTNIGQIKTMAGDVYIVRDNVKQLARAGDLLQQADPIVTGTDSSVGITFIDNSRFSAGPHGRIELKQFRFNPTTQDGMFISRTDHGTLAIISGHIAKHSQDAMKVHTPTSVLGVRGTKLLIKVEE